MIYIFYRINFIYLFFKDNFIFIYTIIIFIYYMFGSYEVSIRLIYSFIYLNVCILFVLFVFK